MTIVSVDSTPFTILHCEISVEDADDLEQYLNKYGLESGELAKSIILSYISQIPIHQGRYRVERFNNPKDYGNLIILHDLTVNDGIYLIDDNFFDLKPYEREIIEIDEEGKANYRLPFFDEECIATN